MLTDRQTDTRARSSTHSAPLSGWSKQNLLGDSSLNYAEYERQNTKSVGYELIYHSILATVCSEERNEIDPFRSEQTFDWSKQAVMGKR